MYHFLYQIYCARGGGSGGGMGYAFQATNEMEAYISAPLLYICINWEEEKDYKCFHNCK